MTLQQLRYFREIARQDLNISKAAAVLHITQPGLSRQLRLLEEELGVELFVRNRTRLVRLSDAGREIVAMAERTLESAQSIKAVSREHSSQREGSLTIATTHTQARYALPGVLRRFVDRYPGVQLSLRQGTPSEVSYLVATGNADLSIATEPVEPDPALVMLPCHKLQRIVLTPTGHPLLKVKRLTLEKLADYPLITYDYAFIGRSKTLGAFEAKGIRPHIALNAIDADVIKTYVEFGLGIAIVPDMAYDRARDKHLRAIDASHLFEPNTIHIGIRRNHYLRGYMFAFIEMFAPHLKRAAVEQAITRMATRSAKVSDALAGTPTAYRAPWPARCRTAACCLPASIKIGVSHLSMEARVIGYVTLGTNDLGRAAAFYDALLAELGAKRLWEFERGIAWGCAEDQPCLGVMKPFDGKPATAGNGVMVALGVDSREKVDRVHRKALALGGKDEGPAGLRGNGFYAGYFRDLDGNKLNVFYYG